MPRNKRSAQPKSAPKRRRKLRAASTKPEKLIWSVLRNRKRLHQKFRRQFSIGSFIADFACPELKLVIELDGEYHEFIWEQDQAREKYLQALGFTVIRFPNDEVLENLEGVAIAIEGAIEEKKSLP